MSKKEPDGYIANLRLMREAAYDSEVQNRTCRIFSILVSHADQEGTCFPSITKMAQNLGTTRQAVQNQIRKLIQMGYISVHTQKQRRTNIFHLRRYSPGCTPPQSHQIDRPATPSGCTKTPLNKPYKETRRKNPIRRAAGRQINHSQGMCWQAATGISQKDEMALETTREAALQGLSLAARIDLDLDLRGKAQATHPDNRKDQHGFLMAQYQALYLERCTKGEITPSTEAPGG